MKCGGTITILGSESVETSIVSCESDTQPRSVVETGVQNFLLKEISRAITDSPGYRDNVIIPSMNL